MASSPRFMEEQKVEWLEFDVYFERIIAVARDMFPDEMTEVLVKVHRVMDERGEDVGR